MDAINPNGGNAWAALDVAAMDKTMGEVAKKQANEAEKSSIIKPGSGNAWAALDTAAMDKTLGDVAQKQAETKALGDMVDVWQAIKTVSTLFPENITPPMLAEYKAQLAAHPPGAAFEPNAAAILAAGGHTADPTLAALSGDRGDKSPV